MQTFFRKISNRKFSEPLESRIFLLNRHNFCCLKKQSLLRSSKSWVHKKCAMVGQHQIKCGHELGAVFFYYCYYKLWESLLNSEYMPLLSTREKRWDSNNFPFQSHHGVSSVMVKLDQILHQWSHFLPLKKVSFSNNWRFKV